MKKTLFTTAVFALLSAGVLAQSNNRTKSATKKTNLSTAIKRADQRDYSKPSIKDGQLLNRGCGTKVPVKQWDEAFNQKVAEHKQNLATGRTTSTTYTIPVVFHIIYSTGEAVGSGHNISQAQVNSQILVLNADYRGTGFNTILYAAMTISGHPAFYDYAVAKSLPAPNAGGVVIANSGITFCLATKNASGTTLTEPGIDRIAWESITGATDPATSDVQSLMDGTIKPATIWDPTKYFNVWTSDGGSSGLLGYATFPPLNASTGVFDSQGEGVSSESTTDGVWVMYQSLGNTGNVAAPYNLGRTLTHESGHYFGLRHTWGDGTCANDFCNDTPPAFEANYVTCGTPYPYVDPYGTCADNGDGEMYMAFMDYSNDSAMWMFTTDQVTRFQTALTNSPWRSGLTASAVNLGAGINQHNPLAENIAFFPNPSNGQINFAITLATPTDLSISVVNTLGQLVYLRTESNISHAVLSYDLSSLSSGIYFINIMDSNNNKTVKKMIIE